MPTHFEAPSRESLLAEQEAVQAEKFQGRILAAYSNCIFPGQRWCTPQTNAAVEFVRPTVGDAEQVTLDGVLKGLIESKGGNAVSWVDMGGGRALPMRQLAVNPEFKSNLHMTNVDLFNYGLDGLKLDELEYLEELSAGSTEPDAEPHTINDDIETVILPKPADIITSIEAVQYLNNPLGALANWYNQLADDGMVFVATEQQWAEWIRYDREQGVVDRSETPMRHVLEELTQAGIEYAAVYRYGFGGDMHSNHDADEITVLAIQKKPGTKLRVAQPVTEVWVSPYKYKAVYYGKPNEENSSIIEVIKSETSTALGATALSDTE